jgi:hypothetical protein
LLRRGDIPALKSLLAEYPDEWSVHWLYTRALLAFQEEQASSPATLKLLKEASAANEHVPAILAGKTPPIPSDSGYNITVGGADEATDYVRECGDAWRKTPGAVEWLTIAISALQTKRRPRKAAH